jgi:hypothetical protein
MAQKTVSFTFQVIGELVITSGTPSPATENVEYTPFQFTAIGGVSPYVWLATGLPAGMILSANGLLSGTPLTSGSFNVVITVQDSA